MARAKAWERMRAGARELSRIILDKFQLHCGTKYDPVECSHLIVIEISTKGTQTVPGMHVHRPTDLIMRHEEPALEFPSEHLKTKLLLITGGTLPA